jgi:hypothetical protein
MALTYPSYRPQSAVRAWLMKFPGLIEGESAAQCIAKAHLASGLSNTMAVDVFAKALRDVGYFPMCLWPQTEERAAVYRLSLPEGGAGVARMR